MSCRGLSLMSGGLDSQLAVRVLQNAGAYVEAVCFSTPFFDISAAKAAAAALGVKLHVVDFTDDEIALVENPPHGFGGAMNPCIDCHALMIRRAGELMEKLGYDFVATGEVQGQRPMSQNRQSLGIVEKCSGLKGRLVRPMSAKLLEPTIPEQEGKLDREKLLDISGRGRERQIALAAEFGIVDYPSPAGGCKLTEEGFCRKLKDLKDHEGLGDRRLVELLLVGRRFRFPDGSSVNLGRDRNDNQVLKGLVTEDGSAMIGRDNDVPRAPVVVSPVNVPGPTAFIPDLKSEADLTMTCELVCAYSRCDRLEGDIVLSVRRAGQPAMSRSVPRPYDRQPFKPYQLM